MAAALFLSACAGQVGRAGPSPLDTPGPSSLPPPPAAPGPLRIAVAYPKEAQRITTGDTLFIFASPTERIQSRDSVFIFGSVGRGDARLTVNGASVPVYSTGGWIAWLPLPDDTIARFDLVASTASETARASLIAYLPPRFRPPADRLAWVDTTSFFPAGARWVRPGEEMRLSVRAAIGSSARVVLPGGRVIPLVPDSSLEQASWGEVAFGTAITAGQSPMRPERYVGRWTGAFGPDPGPAMSPLSITSADSGWAIVEVMSGADTARHRWPLRVGVMDPSRLPVVVVNDDTAHTGRTDSSLAGRPSPDGTYHWFFPNGTVAAVSGRWNSQVRLQLSRGAVAWVDAVDVQLLSPDASAAPGIATSPRLVPGDRSVFLRIPLTARVPFRVDETERALSLRFYGVAADMDWVRYGGTDPLVRLISFSQPVEDEAVVTVELAEPVWGYRTSWAGTTLVLEVRRPPAIDPRRPLAGRRIALDPGHPPAGATGPTGVYEAGVVLAIARRAKVMLDALGAQTTLIRDSDAAMDLVERLRLADRADAEILISVHANALPDGVNPFTNSGTSVYYYQPRSAPLARSLNRALVRQFGVRNLGMGRGDLALARPTWMPSALTEGLFIMVPDQEAMLTSAAGQERYARGLVDGIAEFLRERARPR